MANPAFVNPRLTPAQAEALAATFRPSWELDEPAMSPDATLTDGDMARLHANANGAGLAAVQNGRQVSEPHLPPPPRQASEPEDSVIIDRSITSNDLASTAAPQAQPQAPAFPAPAAQAAPPPAAAPASGRVPVAAAAPMAPPQAAFAQAPAPQAYAPPAQPTYAPAHAARAVAMPHATIDDDIAPPRSKAGLFIGLGVVGLIAIAGIAIVAMKSGGDTPPAPTSTASAPKTDPTGPSIPPPAAVTNTPAAATTTAAATTAAKPEPPAPPPKADKPQKPVAAQPPANTDPPPPPRPPPPKPPPQRPTVPVKEVPF